jgi:hypothetical protein
MSGKEIDRSLKAICDAENADNNGLILYIRNGEIAFATEEELFTVTPLT